MTIKATKNGPHTDHPTHGDAVFLTTLECALIARKTTRTIRDWIASGALPAVQPANSRTWLVKRSDLYDLLRVR